MRVMIAALAGVLLTGAAQAESVAPAPSGAAVASPEPVSPMAAKLAKALPRPKPKAASPAKACIGEGIVAIDPAVGAPLHLGTQSYPQTLNLCDHVVVLTFDDGPSPDTTPLILHALKEAGVHASFFLVGRHTRLHPELARQEYEEGHTVGHHSYTHPSFTLRGFDDNSGLEDIQNGIAEDEKAIYGAAATPDHPHVPFFRFPGFADTPALLSDLDRRGIAVFGSDLWAADWLMMTPAYEQNHLLSILAGRPHHNGIILLHDTRPSTAAMLPDFLRALHEDGYRVAQVVYARNAAAPPLTAPLKGEPETKRIIDHLRTPIIPGSHHLGDQDAADPAGPAAGAGEP